jgi:hypothetical protein
MKRRSDGFFDQGPVLGRDSGIGRGNRRPGDLLGSDYPGFFGRPGGTNVGFGGKRPVLLIDKAGRPFRLGLRDTLQLPFLPQVRFELAKDASMSRKHLPVAVLVSIALGRLECGTGLRLLRRADCGVCPRRPVSHTPSR